MDRASGDWRDRLGPGVGKWVPLENQHVTVAFLGRTRADQVEWIRSSLAEAARRVRPFETGLASFGVFPRRASARVLWIGLDERGGGWDALAASVRDALSDAFPPERREFTPHLTLARFEPQRSFVEHAEALSERVDAPRFEVHALTLYRSRLMRPHARYEPLARFALRG